MREESLQPLPEVVTPICRGPSEYVDNIVKVDKLDASATLTGIRSLLHSVDIRVPDRVVSKDWTQCRSVNHPHSLDVWARV